MVKRFLSAALLAIAASLGVQAADYGLPAGIQDGNILHCFNWSAKEVKAALPQIASAGFGSVQLSPLQRTDVKATGSSWHDLYRPYDLAFKSSGFCTEQDLKDLCSAADEYGIKVVVDVVANHVDKTAGYHDTWWDSNNRVRWEGSCRYDNRYSITHGQLGDYGDVNSELSDVQARGKAYVEFLKGCGVDGIRWDAAKHIATPSEGCGFWSAVTSVPGMWHYGEILNDDGTPVNEYAKYMSITDNRYSNSAAKENGGIQNGYGGDWAVNRGVASNKLVYWAESHDTYANDEWSQNVAQSVIDRAYACVATRNGATALYLARPNTKGFNNIKTGKGSTAFTSKSIAAVNQLRNKAGSAKDYCTATGSAFSCTREGVGAVVVMKGSGNISIANGGGYCPAGSYKDLVSGSTFTVTSSTISGNVGSSGIAVIIKDGVEPPHGGGDDDASMWILGNLEGAAGWSTTPGTGFAMTKSGTTYTAKNVKFVLASSDETKCYFNITDKVASTWKELNQQANRYGAATEGEAITLGKTSKVVEYPLNVTAEGCLSWTIAPGTYDITFDASAMTILVNNAGDTPIVIPPVGGDVTIYYDNSNTNWSEVNIHYWSTPSTTWPGVAMTKVEGNVYKYTFPSSPANLTGFLFCKPDKSDQTADYKQKPIDGHIYKGNGSKGAVTDEGVYQGGDQPDKPVVTANPASGTRFDESVAVTLTVSPAATIYYTLDGTAPSTSSTRYSSAITLTETTTIKTLAVTAEGAQNTQSFSYTKKGDGPVIQPGGNLITDYYKVNPDNQYGTRKTINMSFSGQKSTTALSNWTESDLIAQGVARDICQAYRGKHEYPYMDSYAIYAAYDNDNLYLGVQFVNTVWDIYGDGKLTDQKKPYIMDGRMMWAFDLDPQASFDGYIENKGAIWNDDGGPGAKFNNGVDAIWIGSTKPGVGIPGLFIPTPSGHASYDPAYCKSISGSYYGYADGLLPSIQHLWGQGEFEGDPEALKGNEGFVDLIGEIDKSAHTFYEWKFPLSVLGVTADYIKNNGIGVQYVDIYGSSPTGGTPYDPSYFDNAKEEYSMDDSSSAEKEDEDIITFAPARVGKAASSVDDVIGDIAAAGYTVSAGEGYVSVAGLDGQHVVIAGVDGRVYYSAAALNDLKVSLGAGLYIVNVDGNGVKVVVK